MFRRPEKIEAFLSRGRLMTGAPEMRLGGIAPETNHLTGRLFQIGLGIHDALGPGLYESVYQDAFEIELQEAGIPYLRHPEVGLSYRGRHIRRAFEPDFIVDSRVIVEMKAVEALGPAQECQLLTYLALTPCEVGILMNFHGETFREGYRRRVWTRPRSPHLALPVPRAPPSPPPFQSSPRDSAPPRAPR